MLRARLLATTILATLAIAASAQALPGDPESVPLSPADGAEVLVDPDGIPVSFSCPVYRKFSAGDGLDLFGGPSDHGVSFSRSPALGADGRLADPLSLNTGQRDPAGPDLCTSALGAGGSPPRPQETPGTYHWQLWRLCTGCDSGYETGPVRRIVLRTATAPVLRRPGKLYAGYPGFVKLRLAGVPDGTGVDVERRDGSRWRRAGSATVLGGAAEAVIVLPRGRHALRVRATLGEEVVTSPAVTVKVRAARGWRTGARDNGRYAGQAGGNRSVRFRVTRRGRELRGFKAYVAMTCPGITPGQFTTQVGIASLRRIRIAPDGFFVGVATPNAGTAIRARGRLGGRRVRSGRVELSVGNCVGRSAFSARRR